MAKYKWVSISEVLDRTTGFNKVRWDISAPVLSSGVDGFFSELPNINTDGKTWSQPSGAAWGYASENRFNLSTNYFSSHLEGFTDKYWNTQTLVSGTTYEHTYPTTLYWSGLENTAQLEYIGNKISVYIEIPFSPSTDSLSFSTFSGSQTVEISSSNPWSASTEADWITLSAYSGEGNTEITVSVTQNEGAARNAAVTFTDGDDTFDIEVFQKRNYLNYNRKMYRNGEIVKTLYRNGERIYKRMAFTPMLTLSDNYFKLDKEGQSVNLTIGSDSKWNIITTSEWITISPSSGVGYGLVSISAGPTTENREANISVVADNDEKIKVVDMEVVQNVATYTVDLNNEWRVSETVENPDPDVYDGVYESYSNHNVGNSTASTYVNIEGFENFTLRVRTYGERNWDFVVVSQLDKTPTYNRSQSQTAENYWCGYGRSSATEWYDVTFNNIPEGPHRITVAYMKDSGTNSDDDRGYLMIPKDQQ